MSTSRNSVRVQHVSQMRNAFCTDTGALSSFIARNRTLAAVCLPANCMQKVHHHWSKLATYIEKICTNLPYKPSTLPSSLTWTTESQFFIACIVVVSRASPSHAKREKGSGEKGRTTLSLRNAIMVFWVELLCTTHLKRASTSLLFHFTTFTDKTDSKNDLFGGHKAWKWLFLLSP